MRNWRTIKHSIKCSQQISIKPYSAGVPVIGKMLCVQWPLQFTLFSGTPLGFTKRFRKPKCWLDFLDYLGVHILCKVKRLVLFSTILSFRSWHSCEEDRHLQLLLHVHLKSRIPDAWKFHTWGMRRYGIRRIYYRCYKPLYFQEYFRTLSSVYLQSNP